MNGKDGLNQAGSTGLVWRGKRRRAGVATLIAILLLGWD
jgi:hypothetical protein